MAKTKILRKPARGTAKHRASWKGQLTFGLVSFQVEAFNALDREHSDIHFHHGWANRDLSRPEPRMRSEKNRLLKTSRNHQAQDSRRSLRRSQSGMHRLSRR